MKLDEVTLLTGDLTPSMYEAVRSDGLVGVDLETTGLDWKRDRIATCQIYSESTGAVVVQLDDEIPEILRELIESPRIVKVFHHAPFDLRFMATAWKVHPEAVVCTKVASKIIDPEPNGEHSLQALLQRHLGVFIDKQERLSDWTLSQLRPEQLRYAANDVVYLPALMSKLYQEATAQGLGELLDASFEYLWTRVQTDMRGSGDVFAY